MLNQENAKMMVVLGAIRCCLPACKYDDNHDNGGLKLSQAGKQHYDCCAFVHFIRRHCDIRRIRSTEKWYSLSWLSLFHLSPAPPVFESCSILLKMMSYFYEISGAILPSGS